MKEYGPALCYKKHVFLIEGNSDSPTLIIMQSHPVSASLGVL